MGTLINKRVLLGITGGIAAYKSAELVRRLKDYGADVRVVMTQGAQAFITPLTLQALSGRPVHTDLLDTEAEAAMGHIELARWADVILIAPASANFIAKLALGEASDLLSTLCLAAKGHIAMAPAMNQVMWQSDATQENLQKLEQRGIRRFGPASGGQACGDVGPGRMLEPEDLAKATAELFPNLALSGLKVVITAGPTREAIDPVRYISNHSSGKMGYALAEAAMEAGADVTLISGPVALECPNRVTRISVESARDMHNAVFESIPDCNIFIGAAAVADYRPAEMAEEKIKKTHADEMTLRLIKNPDIIASVAALENKPFTVGFAAETQRVQEFAHDKLQRKNLDLIFANNVADKRIGFNSDENAVHVVGKNYEESLTQRSKTQLARDLIAIIAAQQSRQVEQTKANSQ